MANDAELAALGVVVDGEDIQQPPAREEQGISPVVDRGFSAVSCASSGHLPTRYERRPTENFRA